MARRKIIDWTETELVAASKVAPDRYADPNHDWNALAAAECWRDFKAACTYKPGEVVWVERTIRDPAKGFHANGYPIYIKAPIKARIVHIVPDRDRWGDYRECYIVQFATQSGLWAKHGEKTWPGFIKRGYQLTR